MILISISIFLSARFINNRLNYD